VAVPARRGEERGIAEDRETGRDRPTYGWADSREAAVIRVIRVMVVEDHDLIRAVLAAALRAEPDIEVVACCPDGQTAIEHLDQASPDVVVTDLCLPRVDGVAVTAHLSRHHPRVPVVVFTSAPHGHRAAAARAAAAHTILAKNADPDALITAVRAAAGVVGLGWTSTRRPER
jgi:DNA-binding NarL/FixJ family response regulator